MEKLSKINGILASIEIDNIDTDMIIPKQFLKTIKRTGLGKHLFYEMRYDENEKIISEFILNKQEFKKSQILVTGDNFGCGSSREHAPWALKDFGIRVILATSYADIFYNNCFKNSILPIILKKSELAEIHNFAKSGINNIEVDLTKQVINYNNKSINFDIDPFRKKCLIEGLDDIALTLQSEAEIFEFETKQKAFTPWLYEDQQQ